MNSTSFPWSLKYSAIAVATKPALIFTSEGCSDVATTTIERLIPSGPRVVSINSLTSRPRSPMSAITFKSAFVFLAIIARVVDFPTPEPANTPSLWPLPAVIKASIARIPRDSGVLISCLFSGLMISACVEYKDWVLISPRLSIGRPRPSNTRPNSCGPTLICMDEPVFITTAPGMRPSIEPSGIKRIFCVLNPTTSAHIGSASSLL